MGKIFVILITTLLICCGRLSAENPVDTTSYVYYFSGKTTTQNADDSLKFFLPFDFKTVENTSVSSLGIKAEKIKAVTPEYKRLHIDLNKNHVKENFPPQIFFPILICILLVLSAKFFQQNYIGRLFMVIFYRNAFFNAVSEKNVNADKAGYALFINFILNTALFVIVALYRYDYQLAGGFYISYLTIATITTAYFIIKKFITGVLSHLFGSTEIFTLYYKYAAYIFQAAGILLLALNILSFYVKGQEIHDFVFYLTMFLWVLVEFLKIFKLFLIIIEKRFPIFYLFLYLCAVEFLPVILAVKILSR